MVARPIIDAAPAAATATAARVGGAGWLGVALAVLLLLLAPLSFESRHALGLASQMGIAVLACLSFHVLWGQGGMLSFGHAVYTGLGSFIAIHAMNMAGRGELPLPLWLMPIVGGLAGMFFATLLGFVTTKKSGTTFAMITLGIGAMVFSMSLMLPEFFGGEGGISANRMVGEPVMGITFGPQIQVYYLIAVYCFICTVLMFAFTQTPLGRMLNAVRDNPERVEFIGYDTQRVRYLAFMIAGFFAGIAGGLHAINDEIVTAEVVGAEYAGMYLLFTFLGGALFFFGPILGAILMVFATVLLHELTKAWMLYLGVIFLMMVMYAPGGLSSLIMMNLRVAAFGLLRKVWVAYLALAGTAIPMLVGIMVIVEMVYHIQMNQGMGPEMTFMGVQLSVDAVDAWVGAVFLIVTGGGLFELARRHFVHQWSEVQEEIEAELLRRQLQ